MKGIREISVNIAQFTGDNEDEIRELGANIWQPTWSKSGWAISPIPQDLNIGDWVVVDSDGEPIIYTTRPKNIRLTNEPNLKVKAFPKVKTSVFRC